MKKKYHIIFLIAVDYLIAVSVWIVFFFVRKSILGEVRETTFPLRALIGGSIVGAFWVLLYSVADSYVNIYRNSRIGEIAKVFLLTIIGTIIIFFVILIDDEGVSSYQSYYKTISTYFLIHFIAAIFFKLLVLSYFKRLIKSAKVYFNTLIIGSGKNALDIYHELLDINYTLGNKFVGYVKAMSNSSTTLDNELEYLGPLSNIDYIICANKIEQVVIAIESSEHEKLEHVLNKLHGLNVRIQIIPNIYQMLLGSVKVEHIFAVPLIEIQHTLLSTPQRIIKRLFDIVVSLTMLTLGFPLMLFLVIFTKLSSKGSVFFLQERIGKKGKPFYIIKFRSMFVGAEGAIPELSSKNDPRVTKWGRFMRRTRLDESPQFLNVLFGDMSIVGPRPERRYYIDQIIEQAPHYNHLLSVRPGITSLGQVKYGYAQNLEEMIRRMKYDIIYIENMSIVMDLRIIFFTIPIILKGKGK